jgi:lauroyl/myristoyl acyltransferase
LPTAVVVFREDDKLKKFAAWLAWSVLRSVLSWFPRGRISYAARAAAWLSMIVMARRRRMIVGELRSIMPDADGAELKKQTFEAFYFRALREFEEIASSGADAEGVSVERRERLDASLARGRGVILVTFHFGAHLAVMPALGSLGYKVNQAAARMEEGGGSGNPFSSSFWDRKLQALRARHHGDYLKASFIPLDGGASVRGLFRCLEKNEILVIALDGRLTGRMIALPFFSHGGYWFARGPISLAFKTGAALHPVFVVREGGRNKLVIEDEIVLNASDKTDGDEEAVFEAARAAVARLEDYTRLSPAHYVMYMVEDMSRIRDLDEAFASGRMDGSTTWVDVRGMGR